MGAAIAMQTQVTGANFNEEAYLQANPDVAAVVKAGIFSSALQHFRIYQATETRYMRTSPELLAAPRARKMQRFADVFDHALPHESVDGKLDFLSEDLRREMRIVDTVNVSSNGYDEDTLALIDKYQDGKILDCGCGRRTEYFSNVLNFEIVNYDTTDVIGVGQRLPFKDNSFDAIFSIAVLEHVRDPLVCASEISRVLKPGGDLYCSVPFLQPYHGYPHHYFNVTRQGISRLFEDDLDVRSVYVPPVGHPGFALHWFIGSWLRGVSPADADRFRNLTVAQIEQLTPEELSQVFGGSMAAQTVDELACSFVLRGVKRGR